MELSAWWTPKQIFNNINKHIMELIPSLLKQ